jgi:hypothetical protein
MNKIVDEIINNGYTYDVIRLKFVKDISFEFYFYVIIREIDGNYFNLILGRNILGKDFIYKNEVKRYIKFIGFKECDIFLVFFEEMYNVYNYKLVNFDTYKIAITNNWVVCSCYDKHNSRYNTDIKEMESCGTFIRDNVQVDTKMITADDERMFIVYCKTWMDREAENTIYQDNICIFNNLDNFNDKLRVLFSNY